MISTIGTPPPPRERPAGLVGELLEPLTGALRHGRGRGALLLALLATAYLASGLTRVGPGEVALVLRFGSLQRQAGPGLLIAAPRPFEQVRRIPVGRVHELAIDDLWRHAEAESQATPPNATSANASAGAPAAEPKGLLPSDILDARRDGYVITGDRNLLHVRWIARYRIVDPVAWALHQATPEARVRAAVVRAVSATVGGRAVDPLLAEQREALPLAARRAAQRHLDAAGVGAELISLEMDRLTPPARVVAAFRDVQTAAIERRTEIQRAREYRASEVPQAEAEATRQRRDASTFRLERVARARADVGVFLALVDEHRREGDVVRKRLYRETVERALSVAGQQTLIPPPIDDDGYDELRVTVPKIR